MEIVLHHPPVSRQNKYAHKQEWRVQGGVRPCLIELMQQIGPWACLAYEAVAAHRLRWAQTDPSQTIGFEGGH
jgi:hypothetical protein